MNIDIWSDFVCPFCYIGKRKIAQALESFENREELTVQWRSFQLSAGAVTNPSITVYESLAAEKGWSVEETRRISDQVTQSAAQVGLEYNFDRAVPANTLKAH